MPELPDITLYVEHLERRILGAVLLRSRVLGPNVLRTVEPTLEEAAGRAVRAVRRIGKRIAIGLEGDLWLVLHLMIAGRLQWQPATRLTREPAAGRRAGAGAAPGPRPRGGRHGLAAFEFSTGALSLTEASSKQRASLHVVRGDAALAALADNGELI